MKTVHVFGGLLVILLIVEQAFAQEWDWVRRMDGDCSITSVAVDAGKNVYIGGELRGTNLLGTNRLISAGGRDAFVARLSPEGDVIWVKLIGGPGDDYISKVLVTTNDSVLVCGRFSIVERRRVNQRFRNVTVTTNAFVARLEGGNIAWFDELPSGLDGGANTMVWGPGPTLYLVGTTNRVFVRPYTPEGTLLNGFAVGENGFRVSGLAVSPNGDVFVQGSFSGSIDLGTTNLSSSGYSGFTARLHSNGAVLWARNLPYYPHFYSVGAAGLVPTPDGSVVSLVNGDTGLPQGYTVVVKHSAEGELLWDRRFTHGSKTDCSGYALASDESGNLHITGQACNWIYSGRALFREALWLLTLDANGQTLNEQNITSRTWGDSNAGSLIATDQDGDDFVAGTVMGIPTFGTNIMAGGPSGVRVTFLGRRSTLLPQLTMEQFNTNIVLSWPRTSRPFALQQSDQSGTNWVNVPDAPAELGGRRQVTLPIDYPAGLFRLLRTNELAIRHSPSLKLFSDIFLYLGVSLTAPPIVLATNGLAGGFHFSAGYVDPDVQDRIAFTFSDLATGAPLAAPVTRLLSFYAFDDGISYACYETITSPPFHIGLHEVQIVAAGSGLTTTTNFTFEVVDQQTLLERLTAAVQELDRRPITVIYDRFIQAMEAHHPTQASRELRRFQRYLQHKRGIPTEERAKINSAAAYLLGVWQ